MVTAIILFIIGALFGLHVLTHILNSKPSPKVSVALHGLFVATALVLLIIKIAGGTSGSTAIASLVFFVVAALGGFVMAYLDLVKKQPPPRALALLHPVLAAIGLVILIIFTFGK
ncbi:MAG: hypothetical protein HF314_19390 [Ignavibacteria bacterium]|nr:hypothetical protein [Ignavibacteria bacterium]MCU7505254.1 hypothetical protein [Ignavibacteria bacterium]MCU7518511.1 hypothetical protein [Ignavibacteria bacterium]